MLPPAALDVADRLITALMSLIRAVAHVATTGSTPTLSDDDANTLFLRLSGLVTTLIRISALGVRPPPDPNATPNATALNATTPDRAPSQPTERNDQPGDRSDQPGRLPSLPHHSGWLLEALPDIAPAIAADMQTLLADPAMATLLEAAPQLRRRLCALLRSLGLTAPTPSAPILDPTPPQPPNHATPHPPAPTLSPRPAPTHTKPQSKPDLPTRSLHA